VSFYFANWLRSCAKETNAEQIVNNRKRGRQRPPCCYQSMVAPATRGQRLPKILDALKTDDERERYARKRDASITLLRSPNAPERCSNLFPRNKPHAK